MTGGAELTILEELALLLIVGLVVVAWAFHSTKRRDR